MKSKDHNNNNTVNLTMIVLGNIRFAETDETFVCATLDWWPPNKSDFGWHSWEKAGILNLNLDNTILVNAVKGVVIQNLSKKLKMGHILIRVAHIYGNISSNLKPYGPWVGESGGAFNSGGKRVSSSFANGFWYLDQLGMTSKSGHQVFCRQTLIGGHYGLLDTTTFNPKPDYHSALLWSRLMGKNVLSASHNASNSLRIYSHCSKNIKGISVLIINLSNSTTFEVKFVLLNGTPLKLTETFDIPTLDPQLVNATSPIRVMPHSIVFAILEGFKATACG
ncbi:hypothetical protein CASFOL_020747 [Castilleja foliolosa]|uniref:Uncharacterized protein n=1 Tax=Castilleja foliolosa TaxID=1961234 RepID=A0ABD3D1Q7_9LAMI